MTGVHAGAGTWVHTPPWHASQVQAFPSSHCSGELHSGVGPGVGVGVGAGVGDGEVDGEVDGSAIGSGEGEPPHAVAMASAMAASSRERVNAKRVPRPARRARHTPFRRTPDRPPTGRR